MRLGVQFSDAAVDKAQKHFLAVIGRAFLLERREAGNALPPLGPCACAVARKVTSSM
jgi:hypothetical protein